MKPFIVSCLLAYCIINQKFSEFNKLMGDFDSLGLME